MGPRVRFRVWGLGFRAELCPGGEARMGHRLRTGHGRQAGVRLPGAPTACKQTENNKRKLNKQIRRRRRRNKQQKNLNDTNNVSHACSAPREPAGGAERRVAGETVDAQHAILGNLADGSPQTYMHQQ